MAKPKPKPTAPQTGEAKPTPDKGAGEAPPKKEIVPPYVKIFHAPTPVPASSPQTIKARIKRGGAEDLVATRMDTETGEEVSVTPQEPTSGLATLTLGFPVAGGRAYIVQIALTLSGVLKAEDSVVIKTN